MAKMIGASARELELRSQMRALSEELQTLTEEREKSAAEKLIGKCFRYRNSYGGSRRDEDWWLYGRVVKVGDEIQVFKFETDNGGDFNAKTSPLFSAEQFDGYTAIPFMEFAEALRIFNADVRSFSELAASE